MGTNYYYMTPACIHCGRGDQPRHIGKSSGGWCFALHVYPDEGIHTLKEWQELWAANDGTIVNEERSEIKPEEMLSIITERSAARPPERFDYLRNHAVPGPNNLVRASIYPDHCIGHGDGTWDLMIGEFS